MVRGRTFYYTEAVVSSSVSSMHSISPASVPAHVVCMQGIPVVCISGRLDTTSAPVFDAQTTSLLQEKHTRILLDASALTYVSSVGLRSILRIIKHTSQSGGRTGIFAAPPQILEVIEISGFQRLLDIYPDMETALNGSSG
jgi:anti-anti-sigma factor